MILYSKDETAAENDIKRLEARREEIYLKLEAFHQAAKDLERKELPAIERYFSESDRRKVLIMALQIWFELENINIEIDLGRAADTITLPEQVAAFMAAWDEAHRASNDPQKYWIPAKQKFRRLPVTEEEKEQIYKRHETYIREEKDIELVKHIENTVAAINFANVRANTKITFAKVNECMPWIVPMIEAYGTTNDQGYRRSVFSIKPGLFFLEPYKFTAFDEV